MHSTQHRILYVDHNDDSCELMKVLLTMQRYQVTVAQTAAEGLRMAQGTPFDVYLLDTHLPEVSGLTLCEQICDLPDPAPVAFISSAAYETDKQRGLQAGAMAYFTKPLDAEALMTWLSRLLPEVPPPPTESARRKPEHWSYGNHKRTFRYGFSYNEGGALSTTTRRKDYDSRNASSRPV